MASTGTGPNQPQRTMVSDATMGSETIVSQTTMFTEADSGEHLMFPTAGTQGVYTPIAPNIELGKFLERPVQITSYTWNTGWTDQTFSPWSLYLSTTEIANKLANFPFLRGKLKLKFVINSSPFYYGALRAVYEPLYGLNTTRVETSFGGSKLIPYSQQPGIYIYPQTSTGGEMECPFFYPQDYVALETASTVSGLGLVRMTQYAAIRSANGASSNGCTITVYAWMEDVQLAGFTSGLVLQGDSYVEDGTGVVSAPMTALSKYASYFEKIPVIGKFAVATRIGSSAISHIASLFGWSNTPVISAVMPVKNLPYHDLASAEISQPVSKLTLDPKAEVSVSPYMVGLPGDDELAIANLVQRDSYLTSFTWNTTDAANTLFFSSLVNPLLYDRGSPDAAGTYAIQLTPMAWLARCFRYWRGDVIFTFRVIASPFHRGRLRIHWEPYSSPSSTSDLSHTTMTQVVDIESTTEIEFRVPYLQPIPWLEHTHQGDVYASERWSKTAVKSPNKGDDNGSLVVRCLNNLSAPVDTAPITVLVYVRGASNMQFANPIDGLNRLSYLKPQGGTSVVDDQPIEEHLYLKNWGEPIICLRKLLRRSQLVDVIPMFMDQTDSDLLREYRLPMTKYPAMPGYSSSAYTVAESLYSSSNIGFNYTSMNYFSWIAPAFLALRGSMRWHFNVINNNGHGPSSVSFYRDPGVTMSAPSTVTLVPSTSDTTTKYQNSAWNSMVNNGASGLALTNYEGQPGLSIEFPFMIPFKFYLNNFNSWLKGSATDKSNADTAKLIVRTNTQEAQSMTLERYCAIGSDFNMHFFLCVPTVYYNADAGSSLL